MKGFRFVLGLVAFFVLFSFSSGRLVYAKELATTEMNNKADLVNNEEIYVPSYSIDELLQLYIFDNTVETGVPKFFMNVIEDDIKTFDIKRSFSGTTEKNSKIHVLFYVKGKDGKYIEDVLLEKVFNIGKTGLFDFQIDLPLGESFVIINARANNKTSSINFTFNRKDAVIREKLNKNNNTLLPNIPLESIIK